MVEYRTTREQCQALINGVCPGCGGPLEPIETVDNARAPTFWVGCMACRKFVGGVDSKVFRVARRLVESGCVRPYSHMNEGDYQYLESQTDAATSIVLSVLREAKAEGLLPTQPRSQIQE